MDLSNRTFIVTGGTGELGTAVVNALIAKGAKCRIPYINALEAERFPFRNQVELIPDCDLTSEEDVNRLYTGVGNLWASIHIAGGFAMSNLLDTDKAALMRMLDMNLVSAQLCCRAAARSMNGAGGRIVNVMAQKGLEPRHGSGMSAYVASKAAVGALTESLASELGPQKIFVNAVAPSIINTQANRDAMPQAAHSSWPLPADIASVILFLASLDNKVVNGALVPIYQVG